MSYKSFVDLGMQAMSCQSQVRSIAGDSQLIATLNLSFHSQKLNMHGCGAKSQAVHEAEFWIFSDTVQPLFDCLLGRRWIRENMSHFFSVVLANLKSSTSEKVDSQSPKGDIFAMSPAEGTKSMCPTRSSRMRRNKRLYRALQASSQAGRQNSDLVMGPAETNGSVISI